MCRLLTEFRRLVDQNLFVQVLFEVVHLSMVAVFLF